MVSSSALVFATLSSVASALVHNGPRATAAAEGAPRVDGFTPRPTDFPRTLLEVAELRKRQAQSTFGEASVLVAPGATCGYISGISDDAYYCPATDSCVLFPLTTEGYGSVGCCNKSVCGVRQTCINSSQYFSNTAICDDDCLSNTQILKCTVSTLAYCNSIRFPVEAVQDFYCGESQDTIYQLAYTTFSGQTAGAEFTTDFVDGSAESSLLTNPNDLSTLPTTRPGSSSTTSSSSHSTSSSSTNTVGGASTTSSGSSTPTPTNTGGGSSTPVGAIVGGVVGGAAVLALLGFGLWYMRKRQNSKTDPTVGATGPANPNPPMSPHASTMHTGPSGPSEMGGDSIYQPMQQTNAGYYAPPDPSKVPYSPGQQYPAAYDPNQQHKAYGPGGVSHASPGSQYSQPVSPGSYSGHNPSIAEAAGVPINPSEHSSGPQHQIYEVA